MTSGWIWILEMESFSRAEFEVVAMVQSLVGSSPAQPIPMARLHVSFCTIEGPIDRCVVALRHDRYSAKLATIPLGRDVGSFAFIVRGSISEEIYNSISDAE